MENENLGFDNNFDSVISTDYNDVIIPENTGESPSPVTTAGDEKPEVNTTEQQGTTTEQVSTEVQQQTESAQTEKVDTPKMVPYNEASLLKELSNSIKEESGIEINSVTELKSFITELRENIIEKEFSDENSNVYKRAKELILEEKGIDDNVLAIATGIPYGIDRAEYMEYVTVGEFANQEIASDDFESLKTLYATFHSIKGIAEDDIETYVEADIERNDETLIEKRKEFLRRYAEQGLSSIDDRIQNMHKAKQEFDIERKKQINESISSLLKENEFTKDEIDAYIEGTTKKTEEIILPDGTKRSVTPFEKKKYEYSQKNLKDALKENILFFLDKSDKKVAIQDNKQKSKEAGGFLKNYMQDINSSSEMVAEKEEQEDGFSVVKSQL
jgi:hypothetical protein